MRGRKIDILVAWKIYDILATGMYLERSSRLSLYLIDNRPRWIVKISILWGGRLLTMSQWWNDGLCSEWLWLKGRKMMGSWLNDYGPRGWEMTVSRPNDPRAGAPLDLWSLSTIPGLTGSRRKLEMSLTYDGSFMDGWQGIHGQMNMISRVKDDWIKTDQSRCWCRLWH